MRKVQKMVPFSGDDILGLHCLCWRSVSTHQEMKVNTSSKPDQQHSLAEKNRWQFLPGRYLPPVLVPSLGTFADEAAHFHSCSIWAKFRSPRLTALTPFLSASHMAFTISLLNCFMETVSRYWPMTGSWVSSWYSSWQWTKYHTSMSADGFGALHPNKNTMSGKASRISWWIGETESAEQRHSCVPQDCLSEQFHH